jgi:hypothetical protein
MTTLAEKSGYRFARFLSRNRPEPPLTHPMPSADVGLLDLKAMAEYREVAKQVGVSADDALDIEALRHFLDRHDLPIFNRQEVVSHMDSIAARTNPTGYGWQWAPVRAKDTMAAVTFGAKSTLSEHTDRDVAKGTSFTHTQRFPASDDYSDKTPPYARVMPLHALKKIALIEKGFAPDKVRFLVSDFVLQPHEIIRTETVKYPPPPPASRFSGSVPGVWDESGFGPAQRLKCVD